MTKKDLVKAVQAEFGYNQAASNSVVDLIFQKIGAEVRQGRDVVVHKFGTFKRKIRKARNGRNPLTGAVVAIPEKAAYTFKASINFGE